MDGDLIEAPSPGPGEFRAAAGRFASGVTVVTTRVGDDFYGVTVSAFASLSLNPLLVTVSINSLSPLIDQVRQAGRFAISVLGEGQRDVSSYFATRERGAAVGSFPGIDTVEAATGAPIVTGCLSYFDCELHEVLPGGDHRILVGRVVSAGGSNGEPLVYFDGDYRAIRPDTSTPGADGFEVQLHLLDLSWTELLDAQAAIEPAAAALAADRVDQIAVANLAALLDEAEAAIDDPARFTALGLDFHQALADVSENRALAAASSALRQLEQLRYEEHTNPERAIRVLHTHRRILAHVAAGQADQARAAMAAHVHHVKASATTDQRKG